MMKSLMTFILVILLLPISARSDAKMEIKFGTYLCELPTFADGTKLEKCYTEVGEQYDCLGYKKTISENKLKIDGFSGIYRRISHIAFDGKFESIVYQLFDNEDKPVPFPLQHVAIASAIYKKPNYINIFQVSYDGLSSNHLNHFKWSIRPNISTCQFIQ